jgi:hypothetical protein
VESRDQTLAETLISGGFRETKTIKNIASSSGTHGMQRNAAESHRSCMMVLTCSHSLAKSDRFNRLQASAGMFMATSGLLKLVDV